MDTPILFYKIYQGEVKPVDYIHWALKMLEFDYATDSLNILASFSEPFNIFEVQDFFRRAIKELNIQEPLFEECAEQYIQYLSIKILEDKSNTIDLAYEIFHVVSSLDYPKELEEWYTISEMIDDFRYGDNISKLTKVDLIIAIEKAAKNQLKRNKKMMILISQRWHREVTVNE